MKKPNEAIAVSFVKSLEQTWRAKEKQHEAETQLEKWAILALSAAIAILFMLIVFGM